MIESKQPANDDVQEKVGTKNLERGMTAEEFPPITPEKIDEGNTAWVESAKSKEKEDKGSLTFLRKLTSVKNSILGDEEERAKRKEEKKKKKTIEGITTKFEIESKLKETYQSIFNPQNTSTGEYEKAKEFFGLGTEVDEVIEKLGVVLEELNTKYKENGANRENKKRELKSLQSQFGRYLFDATNKRIVSLGGVPLKPQESGKSKEERRRNR
jgi:hypothetical protein